MHNVKKIELTAFGKAWLLNDDNDRNSTHRRYILLSSSDVSFFPRRSSRSSYRRGNRFSRRVNLQATYVRTDYARSFFLLADRAFNAKRVPLAVGDDLHNDCASGVSSRDKPQYNNTQLTRKVHAKISQGLCTCDCESAVRLYKPMF